jgi:predicted small lipoprotein YifL
MSDRLTPTTLLRNITAFLLVILLLGILGGCGQKGDLYLPEDGKKSSSKST